MRNKIFRAFILASIFLIESISLNGQEKQTSSSFSAGADFVNRYIFRGLDFGESPAIQPSLTYSKGSFTIGAWGSYAFISTPLGIEADLYSTYDFDFGLSLTATEYYFPGERLKINSDSIISPIRTGKYFDYQNSHFFEVSASQKLGNAYISANYGFANMDNSLYFEAGYSFKYFNVFAGAGDKWYTKDRNFNIVNVGISASKEIQFTDKFTIPVSTSIILNPDQEQIHFVFKISI